MARHGKKYVEAAKQVDRDQQYDAKEAIDLIQKMSKANFDQTLEAAFRLGIDTKKADQQLRGAVVLTHGTGKTKRVLVFAKGEKAKEAQDAGADVVGDDELIEKVNQGWMEFDVVVATPDMMAQVGKLGRSLGPKGLMPNPKTGTVTFDVAKAVKDVKAGKVEYRADKAGNVHVGIGKLSFDKEKLFENLQVIYDTLLRAKPAAAKGTYVRKLTLSSTMGPGVAINTSTVVAK